MYYYYSYIVSKVLSLHRTNLTVSDTEIPEAKACTKGDAAKEASFNSGSLIHRGTKIRQEERRESVPLQGTESSKRSGMELVKKERGRGKPRWVGIRPIVEKELFTYKVQT